MDRRNIQRVAGRGSVIVPAGSIFARPPAGVPGREYIIDSAFLATAASGNVYQVVTKDVGPNWVANRTVIFHSRQSLAVTGNLRRSVITGATTTGTRARPKISGGILVGLATGVARAIQVTVHGFYSATGAGTTWTWRGEVNVTAFAALVVTPGAATNRPMTTRMVIQNAGANNFGCALEAMSNTALALALATTALSNSASVVQTLDLTAICSVNQPGTSLSIRQVYVEAIP